MSWTFLLMAGLVSAPEKADLIRVRVPIATTQVLTNGLQVVVITEPRVPLVHLSWVTKNGSSRDPAGQAGLSFLTFQHQLSLSDPTGVPGADLSAHFEQHMGVVRVHGLRRHLGDLIEALALQVRTERDWTPQQFELDRSQAVERIQSAILAQGRNVLYEQLFPDCALDHHPLGRKEELESLRLSSAHRQRALIFQPEGSALIMVGAVSPREGLRLANEYFGSWRKQTPLSPWTISASKPSLQFFEIPNYNKVTLLLARSLSPLVPEDRVALWMLLRVLRAELGRLGASFKIEVGPPGGYFGLSTSSDAMSGETLYQQTLDSIHRMIQGTLLDKAAFRMKRKKALFAFQRRFASHGAMRTEAEQRFIGAQTVDFRTEARALEALSYEALHRMAKRMLAPKRLAAMIVGQESEPRRWSSSFREQLSGRE